MNELIKKHTIIEAAGNILNNLDKIHSLLVVVQNSPTDETDMLLEIIHDYLDQTLEQSEDLKSGLDDSFDKEYQNVISIA